MKRRRAGRRQAGSSLRIASGQWKGRALEVSGASRPTSGRARQALFSILHDSVVGASVLDLYAGSGAVGLEAVSRGAARAVLVEEDAAALESNASLLDPEGRSLRILRGDSMRALTALERDGERFDLVFADPPYAQALPEGLLSLAAALLAPGGLVVLQRDIPSPTPAEPPGVALVERRHYGRNVFYFFARAGSSLYLRVPGS
ncbi:MAG: 16S rRNA (guanine(966)-N(2))-methyltransferase RsmD [Thermoanaerobaculia bacterium]